MIAEIFAATLAVLCIVLAVEWLGALRRAVRAESALMEERVARDIAEDLLTLATRQTLARVKRKSDASKRGWVTRKSKGGAV